MARVASPYVALDHASCEACWECIAICPEAVLGKIDIWFHHHAVINAGERCRGCRRCVKVCAAGALSFLGDDSGHDADIVSLAGQAEAAEAQRVE